MTGSNESSHLDLNHNISWKLEHQLRKFAINAKLSEDIELLEWFVKSKNTNRDKDKDII